MKFIRRILFIALVAVIAIVLFQNQQSLGMPMEFSFLRGSFSLVLGFWILLAFLTGVVLFALADTWRGMMLRMEIRRKEQEIVRQEQEIMRLQAQLDAQPPAEEPPPARAGDAFPE